MKLDMQFLAGEQALPLVLGIWIGGDQRERGEVIAGDPGDTVRVEHVRPVPQPHEPVMLQEADPQHGVLSELPAVLGRHIEHGLEQWLGQAQLTPQIVDRNVRVRQQCELGPMSLQQHRPPRVGFSRHPARQRWTTLHGGVAGRDLALARQRAKHLGVRGQQHRAERHRQLVRQPAHRRHEFVGDPRLVFADAGHRLKGPSRERDEPTGEKYAAPEFPAALRGGDRVRVTQADIAHLTSPSPGSLPTARVLGPPLPS